MFLIISLSFIFSIEISSLNSPSVVADNLVSKVCCEKTIGGSTCVDTESSNCAAGGKYPGLCSDAPFCGLGCCNSKEQGCSPNVGKASCDAAKGDFSANNPSCSTIQCSSGCCVIGNQCSLQTETSCRNLATNYGVEMNYKDDINSQASCNAICNSQENVCCVTSDKCSATTREVCASMDGKPFSTTCSLVADPVCDSCKKEKTKVCYEGDIEKLYWKDSCGNKDSVAENCVAEGKFCGKDESGNYACITGDCPAGTTSDGPNVIGSTKSKLRVNTESWCVADSNPGQDLPGSRQYVHSCILGIEQITPCERLNNQICMEYTKEGKPSYANCVDLNGASCWSQESKEACEQKDIRQCFWNEGSKKCLPKVPIASTDLKRGSNADICNGASLPNLNAQWEEVSEWDCEKNCFIYTNNFSTSMNSLCNTLGDCGANYNLAGQFSDLGFERKAYRESISDSDGNCAWTADGKDCGGGDVGDAPDGGSVEEEFKIEQWNNDEWEEIYPEYAKYSKSNGVDDLLKELEEKVSEKNFIKYKTSYTDLINFNNWLYKIDVGDLANSLGLQGDLEALIGGETAASVAKWTGGVGIALILVALYVSAGEATLGTVLATTLTVGYANVWNPVGWGLLALAVATAALFGILYATTNDVVAKVDVLCKPWQVPTQDSGKYCHLCYEEGNNVLGNKIDLTLGGTHECNSYLCQSLGAACEFKDTAEGSKCIGIDCDNIIPPFLNPLKELEQKIADKKIKCVDSLENGNDVDCTIKKADNNLGYTIEPYLKPLQTIPVGVSIVDETGKSKYGNCFYSKTMETNIEKMQPFPSSSSELATSFSFNFTPLNLILQPATDYQYYTLCKDACNHVNILYKISFKFAKGPDLMPPQLIDNQISPINNAKLNAEGNFTKVHIVLDDKVIGISKDNSIPAGCKWARSDLSYKEMIYNFTKCELPVENGNQNCETIFDNLKIGENKFFIKCKDLAGNENPESLTGKEGYTLYRSIPLKLDDVKCITDYGESCSEIYSPNVTIKAFTSEGAESGKSKCGFSLANVTIVDNTDFLFSKTDDKEHSITLKSLDLQNYPYYVVCEDAARNVAKKLVNMKVMNDKKAPVLKSVYKEGSSIIVKTDEIAICKYVLEGIFKFDSATPFDSTGDFLHSANVGEDVKRINVGCQDRFGNMNSDIKVYLL